MDSPTDTPTPIPTDTPTPIPAPETEAPTEPTAQEPDTAYYEDTEPTVKNYEIKKAVASFIPGVYINNPHEEMRISWVAFICGSIILFILGFLVMFLFKVHEGNKQIIERRYFKGAEVEPIAPDDEDSKGDTNT